MPLQVLLSKMGGMFEMSYLKFFILYFVCDVAMIYPYLYDMNKIKPIAFNLDLLIILNYVFNFI